jgi:two-component system LytT family sensor kinase
MLRALKRYGIVLAAWAPFFVVWFLLAMSYAKMSLQDALFTSAVSMGTATILGMGVWYLCGRLPWPLRPSLRFYLGHVALASAYAIVWTSLICAFDSIRHGENIFRQYWHSAVFGWQLLTGVWIYGLFAGVSYATQIRDRLHERELFAQRAEALANAARLDALRARLNPHFLFNALHTLAALVKFRPAAAEEAIERLGDMLRYTLKEDGRDVVEFSEEFEFARRYLAFEQLRYEGRLRVQIDVEPECMNFDVPPCSIQALAENAVRHAISIRPDGGSICISGTCRNGKMQLSVRDDGPGETSEAQSSHQIGLRSLRERLANSFGAEAAFTSSTSDEGFEARFEVPMVAERLVKEHSARG